MTHNYNLTNTALIHTAKSTPVLLVASIARYIVNAAAADRDGGGGAAVVDVTRR